MAPAFYSKSLEKLIPIFDEKISNLVAKLREHCDNAEIVDVRNFLVNNAMDVSMGETIIFLYIKNYTVILANLINSIVVELFLRYHYISREIKNSENISSYKLLAPT